MEYIKISEKDNVIMGLSFGYHDSAAAVLVNGNVAIAIQEERLSRIKHDNLFPEKAINFCLKKLNISSDRLNKIIYYENPYKKFDRIVRSFFKLGNLKYLFNLINDWYLKEKFDPINKISKFLNVEKNKILFCDHHSSHAAAAFFNSKFENAIVITIDGVGEYETSTISIGTKNEIIKKKSSVFPNSLGLFYSTFTSYLGFEVNEGEYKVMGMAGFGKPKYVDKIRKLIKLKNGKIVINKSFFNFSLNEELPFNQKFIDMFGLKRDPKKEFSFTQKDKIVENQRFADIAASVQCVTEEIIAEMVNFAIKKFSIKNLVFSGGVALNGLVNRKIQKNLTDKFYVYPSPGDSGSAVGCAQYYYYSKLNHKRVLSNSVFKGNSFNNEEFEQIKKNYPKKNYKMFKNKMLLNGFIASELNKGKIVGWFQGNEEWGPRALGSRSILANPKKKEIRDKINRIIKYREIFRPFAPSVLIEKIDDYFDISKNINELSPENYMLTVNKVKDKAIKEAPAIVHIDKTARVHAVSKIHNLDFYNLVSEFYKISNVPILLNTSFNLKGEPIVSSVTDAFRTFELSNIDLLVLENYCFKKTEYYNFDR
tara:strand:- start:1579 stop:3360 length:1782 start_codon:yes stop_codon:yes gene_type:complete